MDTRRTDAIRLLVEQGAWREWEQGRMNRAEFLAEHAHLHASLHWARFLAERRGLSPEFAGVIALLHDVGRLHRGWRGRAHVRKGARLAASLMEGTRLFSPAEIRNAKEAIAAHDRKGIRHRFAYSELLKDADLLARYYENPGRTFSRSKRRRLQRLRRAILPAQTNVRRAKKDIVRAQSNEVHYE